MRTLPLLVALLLVALPLAGAQDADRPGHDAPVHDGDDAGSDDATGNETTGNRTDDRPLDERCADDPSHAACRAQQERFREGADAAEREARYVSFEVDRDNRTLLAYTVGGVLAFDAITFTDLGAVETSVHGAELRVRTNASELRLQDSPRGNLEFKSANHSLVLDLPAGVLLDRHAQTERGHFVVLDYHGFVGKLAADRIVIDGDTLTVYDFAAFHLEADAPAAPEPSPVRQEVDAAIERAEEQRQLGARVAIRAGPTVSDVASGGASGASAGIVGDVSSASVARAEVTEYDDMQVNVTVPEVLEHNSTIDVVVSAELEEGRVVALELDPSVLDGLSVADGPEVAPRYFDLNDDGTWTEVVFRKADSIHDVLDATDDEGQPEYWIVQDEDGLQVLVSFPHWSTHRVSLTLQEVAEFLAQPSVIVGVLAGVAGVAVASATMLWPRRREDEFY